MLGHGSGGRLTAELIQRLFVPGVRQRRARARSRTRRPSGWAATTACKAPRLAFTTDSFVVRPLFFPGGDIGRLAVHGTVNDLAVGGAEPLYLSAAFILEEGLRARRPASGSSPRCARRATRRACRSVTGDTKVVDRGKGDQVFITTTGVGLVPEGRSLSIRAARPGDRIVVSGTIGDHGIAIMSVREGIEFETVLESDTRPADRPGPGDARRLPGDPRDARPDARRGVERAERAGRRPRASASGSTRRRSRSGPRSGAPARCSGSTRSTSPTKGSSSPSSPPEDADRLVEVMRAHPLGRDAAIIGEVVAEHPGMVTMRSLVGGERVVTHAGGRTTAEDLLTIRCRPVRESVSSSDGKELQRWPKRRRPYGRKTQRAPAVKEVHVLWITAGLGCDGDSVSITAATQPSIEDVVLGAIPGLPKVHLHNPVLAYENGDEFMKYWYQAEEGRLDPFVLVVEGSIPNEKIKSEGYWAALGTDKKTGQPITDLRVDRPAGAEGAGRRRGRHLRDLRRHPRDGGQPDRLHGPGRLPGLGLEVEGGHADRQRAGLPGAARQLHGDAALPALPGRRAWRR